MDLRAAALQVLHQPATLAAAVLLQAAAAQLQLRAGARGQLRPLLPLQLQAGVQALQELLQQELGQVPACAGAMQVQLARKWARVAAAVLPAATTERTMLHLLLSALLAAMVLAAPMALRMRAKTAAAAITAPLAAGRQKERLAITMMGTAPATATGTCMVMGTDTVTVMDTLPMAATTQGLSLEPSAHRSQPCRLRPRPQVQLLPLALQGRAVPQDLMPQRLQVHGEQAALLSLALPLQLHGSRLQRQGSLACSKAAAMAAALVAVVGLAVLAQSASALLVAMKMALVRPTARLSHMVGLAPMAALLPLAAWDMGPLRLQAAPRVDESPAGLALLAVERALQALRAALGRASALAVAVSASELGPATQPAVLPELAAHQGKPVQGLLWAALQSGPIQGLVVVAMVMLAMVAFL